MQSDWKKDNRHTDRKKTISCTNRQTKNKQKDKQIDGLKEKVYRLIERQQQVRQTDWNMEQIWKNMEKYGKQTEKHRLMHWKTDRAKHTNIQTEGKTYKKTN